MSAFPQLTLFTVSAALVTAVGCLIWSLLIPVDRACEAAREWPCSHDAPLQLGLGLEVILVLFYVVMVVGLAAKAPGTAG